MEYQKLVQEMKYIQSTKYTSSSQCEAVFKKKKKEAI